MTNVQIICNTVLYGVVIISLTVAFCFLLQEKTMRDPHTLQLAVILIVVLGGSFLIYSKIDASPLWGILGSIVTLVLVQMENKNQSKREAIIPNKTPKKTTSQKVSSETSETSIQENSSSSEEDSE